MGHFPQAFARLLDVYGRTDMFELITLDAGYNSAENAGLIHDSGYGYLMRF